MSSSGNCGYQGFQSNSHRPPPALKPGDTNASLANKYNDLIDGFNGSSMTHNTTMSQSMSARLRSSDYQRPDRRGVSAKFEHKEWVEKPCNGVSMNNSTYVGYDAAFVKKAPPPEWWTKSMELAEGINTRHLKSSYQMDLGMDGEIPAQRPYTAKTSMASTTMDLCSGTTRTTYHIPGYGGFIPSSDRNKDCVAQGDGAVARRPYTGLRLYHRHNLPGYSGHTPENVLNDHGPRLSGMSSLTSSGAGFRGEVL